MLPCAMIVILSWVGFWIDYRSTPARAALGITTVLTVTTLSNSIRVSLPNVAYIKAIDVYLLVCFLFVFATTAEFAIVGVTDIKWLKSHKKRQQQIKVGEDRYLFKGFLRGQTGTRIGQNQAQEMGYSVLKMGTGISGRKIQRGLGK